MTRSCTDWREIGADEATSLVAAEARAWAVELDWDVTTAWQSLEPARQAGKLPGLVYRDPAGRVAGWCCFLAHQGTVHVPMLVAESPEATAAIVAGVLGSRDAAAESYAFSTREAAPGLRQTLARHGFGVTTYRYLSAAPAVQAEAMAGVRPWAPEDEPAAARLLARAYAGKPGVRAFAVHDTAEEWLDYTQSLVVRPGCGQFLPAASFVIDIPVVSPGGSGYGGAADLDGAVLTTDLGRTTSHVAQIAVDPVARGLGLGRALMLTAMSAVAAAGFKQVTLLVDAHNTTATRLYGDLGFQDRAAFVVGVARQPRRSKSVALATGGASTRR